MNKKLSSEATILLKNLISDLDLLYKTSTQRIMTTLRLESVKQIEDILNTRHNSLGVKILLDTIYEYISLYGIDVFGDIAQPQKILLSKIVEQIEDLLIIDTALYGENCTYCYLLDNRRTKYSVECHCDIKKKYIEKKKKSDYTIIPPLFEN